MLASDKAPFSVTGVAVGVVRRSTEQADRAGLFFPTHDAVIWNIAPQEIATVAKPHGPLVEATIASNTLDRCEPENDSFEARIKHPKVGIRVPDRRCRAPPRGGSRCRDRRGRG